MKPLNLDTKNCSPISSNCVIWDGPDISCINLCNGDSVSDVIHKLATELCTLLDQTNVSNYDLTCLGVAAACPPKDFQALIALLIEKICELNNVPADTPTTESGCPDCIVSVAECFVEGTTTNMQLTDYVQAIATKICQLLDSIADLQTQIDLISDRVTVLENATPPSLTLPTITTGCLQNYIAGSPLTADIDVVVEALVNDPDVGYCATIQTLWGASGTAADLAAVLNPTCITAASNSVASGLTNPMSAEYPGPTGWVTTPLTLAETIQNLWIAICDLRNITTVTFTDTDTISFTEIAGLPNYNFSAELNQPIAMIRSTGNNILGGAGSINPASGLYLSDPGYVSATSSAPNGSAQGLCGGSPFKLIGSELYSTFTSSPVSGGSTMLINEDGTYDIGFKVTLTAPVTAPIPTAPNEAVGAFGTGKGWYGGDNVSSNDQATALSVWFAGTSGYTVGPAILTSPSTGVQIPIFITAVAGAGTVVSATILNNPGGLTTADVGGGGGNVTQSGSTNDARLVIDGLTKPTPKVTVVAAIIDAGAVGSCVQYCEATFSPNNSVYKCTLNSTQLGVQLLSGQALEVKLAIIVNDEDPGSPGLPNPRWSYDASMASTDDVFEFFVRKINGTLP